MTRIERTGWRDEQISRRHREFWGEPCKAVDLDWLVIEYHIEKPICLVEYKHYMKKGIDPTDSTYKAIKALADIAGIPFIVAFYWPDIWAFSVIPMNDKARKWFKQGEPLSEVEFVNRLYRLRYQAIGTHMMYSLNHERPPIEKTKAA